MEVYGAQCVTRLGMTMMRKLCASSWGTTTVVQHMVVRAMVEVAVPSGLTT